MTTERATDNKELIIVPDVKLHKVDFRTAQTFFNAYEHLGNCGLGVWHWAAMQNDSILGVVSFGTTCFSRSRGFVSVVARRFGLAVYQICRGGTIRTAPVNTPSQVVSGAMRELRRDRGDCLIVAYADRAYNEVGTIYQACNALYTGQTKPKNQSNYLINGRIMSGWVVRRKYGTRAIDKLKKINGRVVKIPLTQKYRYVFVQTSRHTKVKVLAAFRPFSLPYPTRESENIGRMNIADLIVLRSRVHNGALEGIALNSVADVDESLPPVFVRTMSAPSVRSRDGQQAVELIANRVGQGEG